MIQGKEKYYEIPLLSSTLLAEFIKDKYSFYKKYILQSKEVPETSSMRIGKLVETYLLEPEKVQDLFEVHKVSAPTGKMYMLAKSLVNQLSKLDPPYSVDMLSEILDEAISDSKFKISRSALLKRIEKENIWDYVVEKASAIKTNKTCLTIEEATIGTSIAEFCKTSSVIYSLLVPKSETERLIQHEIVDFNYMGARLKSKLDLLEIDHNKKEVNIYDLKTTYDPNNFRNTYFLKKRAYIQAFIYWEAAKNVAPTGYKINFPLFIVIDSTNSYEPLVYETNQETMEKAKLGFTENGKYYMGVDQALEDFLWSMETGNWRVYKHNYNQRIKL